MSNVARDVAAAIGIRPQLIPTPWVNTGGRCSDDIPHVHAAMDQFIDLTGNHDAAHFPGAQAWRHEKMTKSGDAEMFFVKANVLMCETATCGSQRCIADRLGEPRTYAKTVTLAALNALGIAGKDETRALSKLMQTDRMVDLRFEHDVHQEVEKMRAGKSGAAERPQKKGRKKKKDEEEPPKEPEPVPAPQGPEQVQELPWSRIYGPGMRIILDSAAQTDDCAGMDRWSDSAHMWERVRSHLVETEHSALFGPPGSVAADAATAFVAAPYTGPEQSIVPKVTFTVTALPYAHGSPDIAGLYVRFLIHDVHLNPGDFFMQIFANAKRRESQNMQGADKRGGGFGGAPELFPAYGIYYQTNHPAGNDVSRDVYFEHVLRLFPEMLHAEGVGNKRALELSMKLQNPLDRFHLFNVLTTERACRRALAAGCDERHVGPPSTQWWSPQTRVARFPKGPVTYVYRVSQVFWYHPDDIGLSEHYFPHIDLSGDFLATLVAGGRVERFLDCLARPEGAGEAVESESESGPEPRGAFHEIAELLRTTAVIKRHVLANSSLVDYQTNNEFVHRSAEAALINAQVAKYKPAHLERTYDAVQAIIAAHGKQRWRDVVARNPVLARQVTECEIYNEVRTRAQAACSKWFTALWQTDGDIASLPIPESLRAMLKWYVDNKGSRLPSVTRPFVAWDPELGIFGNSMLKSLKIYSCVALILQPIVCLLAEGLFSCYRWSPQELAFNMMCHGRYDTGKSYMAITTLLKFTTIPKTVEMYTNATPAADATQCHRYDLIIASDETMAWKVNSREAEKNPNLVNKEKVKLTARRTDTKVFKMEKGPLGEDVRWARTITNDHYVALVEVTNETVESTKALSSRYHRMVIAQPRVPAREMQCEMDALLKDHARTYLQLNQFLSAGAYKLVQCGGMLEPDLQLFHDISNRVIDYLCKQNAIDRDQGNRNLEIMKPYVIQCIIHQAIRCVFDMPQSPHYRKPFEPSMLCDLQRYMYATVDIVWWCWTSLASAWIEDINGNVIRAACKVAGLREGSGTATPYQMYERDTKDRIPWRRHDNPAVPQHGADSKTPDAKLIDLQYVTLRGEFDKVCMDIAKRTVPHLDHTDVKGALLKMAAHSVPLPGGGFVPQPEGRFRHWHKEKNVDGDGSLMPMEYRTVNDNYKVPRTEADVPRYGNDQCCYVVDLADSRTKKQVHIMPHIAASFSNSKIVDALQYATMHKNMRPGKILLGLPVLENPMQMQVFSCPQEKIDEIVVRLDNDDGWDARGRWIGYEGVAEEERTLPRSKGISFNRRGGISEADSIYFTAEPTAPVRDHERDTWAERAERAVASISALQQYSSDLDADSAKRRHIACGLPLDEPVHSPAFILAAFQAAKGRDWHQGVDYPHDNAAIDAERNAIWNGTTDMIATARTLAVVAAASVATYDQPRNAERMTARREARAEKDAAREEHRKRQQQKRARVDSDLAPEGVDSPAGGVDQPREVHLPSVVRSHKRAAAEGAPRRSLLEIALGE